MFLYWNINILFLKVLRCPEYIVRLMVFAISILYIFKNINRLFQKKNYTHHATLYHLAIEKKIKFSLTSFN